MLSIILYKLVVPFESVDGILKGDHKLLVKNKWTE